MHRKTYWLPLFILFLPSAVYSQTNNKGTINGVVVNESTRRPVEFVIVVIQNISDSVLITGMVTDKNGTFEFNNILDGEYIVKCRLLSYKENKSGSFKINAQQNEVNLGTITLAETTVNLDEVLITSQKELFNNSLSLVLTVADIFKSLKRETTTNATDFTGWLNQKRDSRVIYFGLTYTFGAPPKKAKDEPLKYDNGL